jgi:hypothetical protein
MFGWKIATIWAVEEPETYLHNDLENQLAAYFAGNTDEREERFQIFTSTHSSVFPQYGDAHYLIEKVHGQGTDNNYWTNSVKMGPHEFVLKIMEMDITGYINLLSLYPLQKILLVEGNRDEYVFQLIVNSLNKHNIKVFSINHLLNDRLRRGSSQLELLLKSNSILLKKRNENNKIVFIFDWDVETSVINKLKRYITPPNVLLHLDINKRTSLLDDKTFRGLEAFYPIDYIKEVMALEKGLINDRGTEKTKNRYYCDSDRYELVKEELFKLVKEKGINSAYLTDIVKSI